MSTRFKIFSDPVHGFISVPRGLLLDLIESPEVQRLRRVRQLGVGYMVFPGAENSRFGHTLGAMALMADTLQNLREKGTPISSREAEAAMAAALLHDVGHGPFSHTLEHELITSFRHEDMSRAVMVGLNERFEGRLELALSIFDNRYERSFFHSLVSSQLDMDRLDYLRRDAFYTGVSEGSVGVGRIIKTMRVHPTEGGSGSRIVIEEKGRYAVENFIIARRLMYWQVYLHKTVVAGENLLRAAFRRFRDLDRRNLGGSKRLRYFLESNLHRDDLASPLLIRNFIQLDDADVLYSLKSWMDTDDAVLSDLSRRFIERDFLRVVFQDGDVDANTRRRLEKETATWLLDQELAADPEDAQNKIGYYLTISESSHSAYRIEGQPIAVLDTQGHLKELSETGDTSMIAAVSEPVRKPFICGPKELITRA